MVHVCICLTDIDDPSPDALVDVVDVVAWSARSGSVRLLLHSLLQDDSSRTALRCTYRYGGRATAATTTAGPHAGRETTELDVRSPPVTWELLLS